MIHLDEARAVLATLAYSVDPLPGRVTLTFDGPIAEITVDNPSARNAMTPAMMVELADAVRALSAWDGGIVLLRGAGDRAFCAGGHLDQVMAAVDGPERAAEMCRAMSAVLDGLLGLPCLSIAVIGGVALGGGAELATACDLRLVGPGARLQFVQARLAIASGWGGVRRLVRHVGRRRALLLAAGGHPVTPGEAIELGLADARIDEPLDAAARRWIAEALPTPVGAIRAAKRQILAAEANEPEDDVAAFAERWGGPEHRAALAAIGWGR